VIELTPDEKREGVFCPVHHERKPSTLNGSGLHFPIS